MRERGVVTLLVGQWLPIKGPRFKSLSGSSLFLKAPLCPPSTKWVDRSLRPGEKFRNSDNLEKGRRLIAHSVWLFSATVWDKRKSQSLLVFYSDFLLRHDRTTTGCSSSSDGPVDSLRQIRN
ncbi:hypothetical protein PoB_006364200 [Plakobranchus ocellatus]|uniref:Uncharacterized protein n=1 Tax=Plakobranchus ocellatus TaxID=259542 RepID=A0AAV4CZ06_9GAST|nr:hypothetical protein PoB_006364200 [Plakobranchus ocellatus]